MSIMEDSRLKSSNDMKKINAKLIKESFGDMYSVESGKAFTKTWTFRNTGEVVWPADTKLVFTNGAEIGE